MVIGSFAPATENTTMSEKRGRDKGKDKTNKADKNLPKSPDCVPEKSELTLAEVQDNIMRQLVGEKGLMIYKRKLMIWRN